MNRSLLEQDSDQTLLEKISKSDETAFDALYGRYGDKLFHYIYGFFYDVNVAEDVASDFWATVWTRAHTYRGEASVKNWLYRIARNKALDELRRSKNTTRHVEEENQEEILSEIPDDRKKPDDELGQKQERELMRLAILKLSKEHREVLDLFYYEGMKYQEIGEALEIPLGTVKTRLLFARKQLQNTLKDSGHCKGIPA